MMTATSVILGPILSPNHSKDWDEAIAINGDEIVFVGSKEDLDKHGLIGKDTSIVTLQDDQIVIPGFQDGHVHPLAAGISETRCNLKKAHNLHDALEIIKNYIEIHTEMAWINGNGWHFPWFAESMSMPKAEILDAVTSDKPVVFRCWDGHSAWCNSKALQIAGLYQNTSAVQHEAHVVRDPVTRFPTGLFYDDAMELIYRLLPPLSLAYKMRGLSWGIKEMYKYGITSFQDAMVRKSNLDIYLTSYGVIPCKDPNINIAELGQLPRASLSLLWELETGFDKLSAQQHIAYFIRARELVENSCKGHVLRASTIKFMLDGVLDCKTAYLHAPYHGTDQEFGKPNFTKEELMYIFEELDKNNFQIHIHAIGDGAVTLALDAIENSRKINPAGIKNRHHIAHLQLISPQDRKRFLDLNVVANFQPNWFVRDDDMIKVESLIGLARYEAQFPLSDVLKTGARIAFGSDYSCGNLNPIAGIHTAVNHFHPAISLKRHCESHSKVVVPHEDTCCDCESSAAAVDEASQENDSEYAIFLPSQKIDVKDAVYCYTMGSAFVNYIEKHTGNLEVGKKADLLVLSKNIFNIPPEEIYSAEVVTTMANGVIVYKK